MSWPTGIETAERRPWRVRDGVLALLGGLVATVIALVAVASGGLGVTDLFGVVVPAQSVGTLAVVALLARRRTPWRQALRGSVTPGDAIGLLIGAGLQIALSLAAALFLEFFLRRPTPTQEVVGLAAEAVSAVDWVLVVLGVVILAPLAEEVVFRGIILRALEERRGRRPAVYLSAAGFAVIHLLDPNAIVAVPFLFVLGIVLGNQVIRTGRLGRAVMIHAGFNLVTVAALFSVASG